MLRGATLIGRWLRPHLRDTDEYMRKVRICLIDILSMDNG